MERTDTADIHGILDQIRAQLADLTDRVAKLESKTPGAEVRGTAHSRTEVEAQVQQAEPISEEILLAIPAAVAAYLGEGMHIRQIRLISSPAWAQQGRVWIQASHRLH
jgi:methylmalonyl-CoA carboxyltransferase large subunit